MKDDGSPDAELLAATARGEGDGTAFGVLVRRYIRAATLLAVQLLGDADEAEDVVQDAFTVVHKNVRTYDPARPFAPWFFSIVRRLAANRRRRELRRARLLRLWRWRTDSGAATPPADATALARLDAEAAERVLKDLSPMQRACFELVAVRGLSIEDVAAMHGISESTVRQHVFRARAVLRGALGETRAKMEQP
ncbi:MAG: RNA polymerase sigma factor [Gemmatimonadaceae bacterium]